MGQGKTIVSGMAGRYALALFELAKDSGSTDAIASDLNHFGAMIMDSPDLDRFLKSPVFSAEDQMKALSALLTKAGIEGLTAKFLKLVASKRRLFAVPAMIRDYNLLNDLDKGVTRAQVISAAELRAEHIEALKDTLASFSSGKTVEIAIKVDPSLIGGLIVKLGSRMIDSSLKTKLNSIRTRMKEVG